MIYRGIKKLVEEMGEVAQAIGKLEAFPLEPHPDGKGYVVHRFNEELTDLQAVIDYMVETNDNVRIDETRRERKLNLFREWGMDGIDIQTMNLFKDAAAKMGCTEAQARVRLFGMVYGKGNSLSEYDRQREDHARARELQPVRDRFDVC